MNLPEITPPLPAKVRGLKFWHLTRVNNLSALGGGVLEYFIIADTAQAARILAVDDNTNLSEQLIWLDHRNSICRLVDLKTERVPRILSWHQPS